MNCKHVEPLLPLYVGSDLEEERSQLVAAHLHSCTECARLADEYAEASRLLQRYEPPFVSDEVYSGIRGRVLNEIERKSYRPPWSSIFSQFLAQPRMRWITAALLLAVSVIALYLSRNRSHQMRNDPQVAVRTGEPTHADRGTDLRSENTAEFTAPPSLSGNGPDRGPDRRTPGTGKKKVNPGVAANRLRQSKNVDASTNDRVVRVDIDASQSTSASAPVRVELQTSNRNIRIIWLSSQRTHVGVSGGSKGT